MPGFDLSALFQPEKALLTHLKAKGFRPRTVFDIGASTGVWSECISSVIPGSAYYLYEPLADIVDEYRSDLDSRLSRFPQWRLFRVALGDQNGAVRMVVARDGYRSSCLEGGTVLEPSDISDRIEVPMWRMDDHIRQHGLPQPGLIKLDCQGYEAVIIRGALEAVRHADLLFLETWLRREYGPDTPLSSEIDAPLREMGFQLVGHGEHFYDRAGELYSLDAFYASARLAPLCRQIPAFSRSAMGGGERQSAMRRSTSCSESQLGSLPALEGTARSDAGAAPLVSIVTPSLNMAHYLREAIDSVLSQDYPKIEYIVVDGGSTDGTPEILESYGGRLRYRVGPDGGAAEAISRGFRESRGSIFAWLSADDRYCPGAVRLAVEQLLAAPEACAVYGDAHWIDASGETIRPYPTQPLDVHRLGKECCVCQPACFFRRSAFEAVGGLDTTLQSAFDYDLWIRMAQRYPFRRVPALFAASRMHSANKTLGRRDEVFEESIRVLRRHYHYVPLAWIHAELCRRTNRRDPFPEPLPLYPREFLLSLPLGCRRNRRALGRFLFEWAGMLPRAVLNLVRG